MQISLLLGMITKAAWDYPAEGGNNLLRNVRTYLYIASIGFKCYINTYLIFDAFGLNEVPFKMVRGPNLL